MQQIGERAYDEVVDADFPTGSVLLFLCVTRTEPIGGFDENCCGDFLKAENQ
jgi:hypothetical protein